MGTTVPFTTTVRPQGLLRHFPPLPCNNRAPLNTPNFFAPNSRASSSSTPLQVSASSTIGATNEELGTSSSRLVGENDLLIVGPGVLGRLVAQRWKEEHPGCQIHGQTLTIDHHQELIEAGINPSLKAIETTHNFPYVIFCAPPSRSPDYAGDVREAMLSWNGEGSFLLTSSSALYDCNDNGQCDEDTPEVPIGRSSRTDVLLKGEKVVLAFGGCVVRLAGLYISFAKSNFEDYYVRE